MGAFTTYCGFYCALTSGVGMYFYLVLALMELKGNLVLRYIWNVEKPNNSKEELMSEHSPDQHTKGIAFLVLVAIEAVFLIGCCICANVSTKADEDQEEADMKKAKQREYLVLSQMDGQEQIES